eukprot:gene6433-6930_t
MARNTMRAVALLLFHLFTLAWMKQNPMPSIIPQFVPPSSGEISEPVSYPYDHKIFVAGERELTMNCLPVSPSQLSSFEIQSMKDNLFHVLRKFREQNGFGRAIAAPQLGYPFRLIALHYNGTDTALYNPVIINHSLETFTMWDDCLSFPDKMCCIRRYKSISVQFVNEKNQLVIWNDCSQDLSELLQHEIDHLNGVLAIDKAEKPFKKARSLEEITDSVEEKERKQLERSDEEVPAAIVSRKDWLERPEYYNRFVDFHY